VTYDLANLPDPDSLGPEELKELLAQLEDFYRDVESQEPEDEDSEEYEAWLEDLEETEAFIEEIRERMEEKQ